MIVEYLPSFGRDLKSIQNTDLLARIQRAIETLEQAATLRDVPNLIKLQGGGDFYRLRVGDYRLGLALQDQTVLLVRCLDRREIYRQFP